VAQAFRLWVLTSKVRSVADEMAPEQVFPTNHHSTVASYASITAPWGCALALAGYRVKDLVLLTSL
jgi:hypothetical protein